MKSHHCQLPEIRDGVCESEGEKDIALAFTNAFKSNKPFFATTNTGKFGRNCCTHSLVEFSSCGHI